MPLSPKEVQLPEDLRGSLVVAARVRPHPWDCGCFRAGTMSVLFCIPHSVPETRSARYMLKIWPNQWENVCQMSDSHYFTLPLKYHHFPLIHGLPCMDSDGKESTAVQETRVWSLGWEDSHLEANGHPLQYSCLENSMHRGACWAPPGGHKESWQRLTLTDWLTDSMNWLVTGRTEAPILWPPDANSRLIRKDLDAGKDWGQEEKGTAEYEMAGWHHRLNGHGFEQTPGDNEGQGSLVCCSPWGRKQLDVTEQLNNGNKLTGLPQWLRPTC